MKALQKMGVDYESIKGRYPKLVYAICTGYGETGPDKDLPGFDFTAFFARGGYLDSLRQIKDAEEISCIRKACEIADRAFEDVLKFLRPGISELEVAAYMENCMRQLGSEEPSFKTIVASGERGSLPHGIATEKLIVAGMLVTDEPGVYIPSWGGLRIEDTVLVAEDGGEPLTKSSKKLIELV